jgi:hypothetical protein
MKVQYHIRVNVEWSKVGTDKYLEDVKLMFLSSIPFFPQKGVPIIVGRENLTVEHSYWDDKNQCAHIIFTDFREGVTEEWYKEEIVDNLKEDGWVEEPIQDPEQFED